MARKKPTDAHEELARRFYRDFEVLPTWEKATHYARTKALLVAGKFIKNPPKGFIRKESAS